jgi:Xaa-Pro aminopeptidase
MTESELFRVRIALVQCFLQDNDYDGILLNKANNFAMATGGKRSYIYMFSDAGACSLFVTKDGAAYFVGNTIEEPRVMDEELANLDVDAKSFLWFDDDLATIVQKAFSGTLVSDDGSLGANVDGDLSVLRALLTEDELEKYRRLGALAVESMLATLDTVKQGEAEADIAARLIAEGTKRRCMVPVALVASDSRIEKYRHPLPTEGPLLSGSLEEKCVDGYVMIVGCFVREGLVASITRFKQVGDVPEYVPDAFNRICAVDALMQEASEPGHTLGDVFAVCQKAYAGLGFPENEWHNHHQGGSAGYAGRTCKGAPGEAFPIGDPGYAPRVRELTGLDVGFGNAFAWNPSAVGVKSEDTFIISPDGAKEIVTATPSLPQVDLTAILGRDTDVVKSGIAC